MNYIQGNLRPGEKIVIEATKSPIAILPNIILSIFILIVGTMIELGGYAVLAVIIYMACVLIVFKSAELCVTDKKVIGKTGVFNIKSLDAFLDRIDNISLSQSFFGRIFNYSTISISTHSGHYNFLFINQPLRFKHVTMDQMEIYEESKVRKQAEITMAISNGTFGQSNSYNMNNPSPVNSWSDSCPECGAAFAKNAKFCKSCGYQRNI